MTKPLLRNADPTDVPVILEFIRQLAIYEKLSDQVVASLESLHQTLFVEKNAEVILAFEDENPVGFALFFHNYSTFLSRKGLYLEDLFVLPEKRGKGYGKALLMHLVGIAKERNCGRMEWSVLDWNQPAIDFYKSIGAQPLEDWTVFRLNPAAHGN